MKFEWKKTDKTDKNYKGLKLGSSGTTWGTGFNPTQVGMFVEQAETSAVVGYNNGTYSFVNPKRIAEQVQDPELGLAVAMAHEIGFHGIGGDHDWIFGTPEDWNGKKDSDGFVDSRTPPAKPGVQFSKQACKEICDELDID